MIWYIKAYCIANLIIAAFIVSLVAGVGLMAILFRGLFWWLGV